MFSQFRAAEREPNANLDETEQRMRKFWREWRDADFSWDGLKRKSVGGGKSLQDVWRAEEENLVRASDGKLYTIFHSPIETNSNDEQLKVGWSGQQAERAKKTLRDHVRQSSELGIDLNLTGVVLPDELTLDLSASNSERYRFIAENARLGGIVAENQKFLTVDFSKALITGPILLRSSSVRQSLIFFEALVLAEVNCAAMENGSMNLSGARFNSFATFNRTEFTGPISAEGVYFDKFAGFFRVQFYDFAWFSNAVFNENAWFHSAVFHIGTHFWNTRFNKIVNFSSGMIAGETIFTGAKWPEASEEHGYVFFNTTLKGNFRIPQEDFCEFAIFNGAILERDIIIDEKVVFDNQSYRRAIKLAEDTSFARSAWEREKAEEEKVEVIRKREKEREEIESEEIIESRLHPAIRSYLRDEYRRAQSGLGVVNITRGKYSASSSAFSQAKPPKSYLINFREERLRELEGGLRALRKGSEAVGDATKAQRFFRLELITKRRRRKRVGGLLRISSYLYQLLSDFGGSMGRPLFWIGVAWLFFACIFALWPIEGPRDFLGALNFSARNIVRPFSAWASAELYPDSFAATILQNPDTTSGLSVRIIATVQSFFSLILLFLFGLAARRQFQIGDRS